MRWTQRHVVALDERAEEKRALEREIRQILIDPHELLNFQRYLLGEALGHIYAGRFSLARGAINDVYKRPDEFSATTINIAATGATNCEALLRTSNMSRECLLVNLLHSANQEHQARSICRPAISLPWASTDRRRS